MINYLLANLIESDTQTFSGLFLKINFDAGCGFLHKNGKVMLFYVSCFHDLYSQLLKKRSKCVSKIEAGEPDKQVI